MVDHLPKTFQALKDLRRVGSGYFARCPFHNDRRPSLHISQVGGRWLWYCFGCGAGGDEKDLEKRLGLSPRPEPRVDFTAILERAWRDFENNLEARLYLRARGVSMETAEAFRVGSLRGAIAIPMQSALGQFCGIKLRRLGNQEPRYWSVRGSREGTVAPVHERPSPVVLVVEGAMDAMALFPWAERLGLFVVAAKDPDLIRSLVLPARVLVWMDEDEAGERFAAKIMEAFGNMAVRVPPTGFKDPAELVQAAARGQAPDPAEILRPLIARRHPAWVLLWAAAAQQGWMAPPPVQVSPDEIQQALPTLHLLGREAVTRFLKKILEQGGENG